MVDIQTTGYSFSDLLPPNDLQFSEITSRSFRTSWTPPAAKVMSYLVRYRKAEDITGDYISIALPGDATSVVLQHLFPLTAYEVNVFAQYDKGDSFPLSGEETTLEGTVACAWNSNGTLRELQIRIITNWCVLCCAEQGPVRNLRVSEETINSFRVSWRDAPGPVIRYRLSYVPLSGTGEILEAQTIGTETSIVLQELFPITTYRVSVFAEYSTGLGQEMQIDGTTKEGEPENLFQNDF